MSNVLLLLVRLRPVCRFGDVMSRRLVIGGCRLWSSLVMWVERLLFVNWWRGGIRVGIMLIYSQVGHK
jgi:hypothetical protein